MLWGRGHGGLVEGVARGRALFSTLSVVLLCVWLCVGACLSAWSRWHGLLPLPVHCAARGASSFFCPLFSFRSFSVPDATVAANLFFQILKYFLLRANHQSVYTWMPEIALRFHRRAHTGRRVHVALRAIDQSPPLASPPPPASIRAPLPSGAPLPLQPGSCTRASAVLFFLSLSSPTYDVPWPLRYVLFGATGASRGTQSARDRRGDGSSLWEIGVASCLQHWWSF